MTQNEGTVKFIRYNEEFVKNHVRYNNGSLYPSFRYWHIYWQYWHLGLDKFGHEQRHPLLLGVESLYGNIKLCKRKVYSMFVILVMKFWILIFVNFYSDSLNKLLFLNLPLLWNKIIWNKMFNLTIHKI